MAVGWDTGSFEGAPGKVVPIMYFTFVRNLAVAPSGHSTEYNWYDTLTNCSRYGCFVGERYES